MIGEQKFIQTQLTVLVYVILLFYLKNAVINSMDIPRKLLNYVKVYYSFLLFITVVGFFRSLLVLLHIGITQWIQKVKNFLENGKIMNSQEKGIVTLQNKTEEQGKHISTSKRKQPIKSQKGNSHDPNNEFVNNTKEDEPLKRSKNVQSNFEDLKKLEGNSHMKEMECSKRKNYKKKDIEEKEEKLNLQMSTLKPTTIKDNHIELENIKKNENNKKEDKEGSVSCDERSSQESINQTEYKEFFKNDKNELAMGFFQVLETLSSYTDEEDENRLNEEHSQDKLSADYVQRVSETLRIDTVEDTESENSLLCSVNDMNNETNMLKEQQKTPLKSILKKKEESNTLVQNQHNKNVNTSKRKIRFNKDVQTFFFEKHSFEEEVFHDKRSIYKFLESYNLINANLLGYNLKDHLKLAVHDILNPVFDFKDRIFNWF